MKDLQYKNSYLKILRSNKTNDQQMDEHDKTSQPKVFTNSIKTFNKFNKINVK